MTERVIGIDAGGTMTKAALFDLAGNELACARRHNQMIFPVPGHTERDPERMWRAAAEAVAEVLASSGTAPADIAAVSVAGYGSGLYVVDAAGQPVRPGIVSTDSRGVPILAEWTASGAAARAAALIQQRIWPAQTTALLAWLARHEPETLQRTASVLFCKDFLRLRLCGDISTDPTDAAIAGLIDVTTSSYALGMFEELGLGAWLEKMPPIGPADEIVGTVSATAARATGLRPGTPVVRGAVDVTAAAIASGLHDASQLSIVAGTFSINSTLHPAPRLSTMPFLQSPYPIGNAFLATEGAATSASNLEWFCKTVLDGEAARAATRGLSIYDVCNTLVADGLGRDNDILFFPFLFGGPDGAPAGLLGLSAGHELGDVIRAIYEGIVFAHKHDIDILLSGPDAARPTSIRLAGGASRSKVWAQLFADALDLPVEIPAGTELGAQGVAIIAAAAIGAYPDLATAQQNMVRVGQRYEPRGERTAIYTRKHARYIATAGALGAAWAASERRVA
ncbi:FGGY-family carbohydrate kinase [Methylobrevis albus]|uniref:Carbohydrate kinase n=1 Tax=Methylobrevis albus TaxID=2793297 RepID=A0A931I3C4_9HYPH|nr:FGGY-family carbohydrate kinase [Methylobrevis albus]MBH0239490.1 carbohydrate kinase [Methylobrevis albus]